MFYANSFILNIPTILNEQSFFFFFFNMLMLHKNENKKKITSNGNFELLIQIEAINRYEILLLFHNKFIN